MGGEWKPGDVGITGAQFPHEKPVLFFVTEHGDRGKRWVYADGDTALHGPREDARPLVVIDPEDREQVERLMASLLDSFAKDLSREIDGDDVRRTQRALRSLVTPPKPDEPMGLGAVVEDADGQRWVRWNTDGQEEAPWTAGDGGGMDHAWPDIAAVKILSPGVTP